MPDQARATWLSALYFLSTQINLFTKVLTMKSLIKAVLIASLALSTVSGAYAQSEPATSAASNSMSSGEVKKVDKSTGKVTIKHGPLKNIGMDAMTMVFRVKEPS